VEENFQNILQLHFLKYSLLSSLNYGRDKKKSSMTFVWKIFWTNVRQIHQTYVSQPPTVMYKMFLNFKSVWFILKTPKNWWQETDLSSTNFFWKPKTDLGHLDLLQNMKSKYTCMANNDSVIVATHLSTKAWAKADLRVINTVASKLQHKDLFSSVVRRWEQW
jgi:hypothetical protein